MCSKKHVLKCWNTVKVLKPKQRYETRPDGMVVKTEKIEYMVYG